jgi:ABC-type lipoprotein release transport system permease subunit
MGFTKKQVGSVFWWESIFITGLGGGIGIICGIILCLLQEHFGFIKLNGDESTLIVSAYPVAVEATDILIVMIPLVIIGLITAQITSRFARSRIAI